MNNLPDIIALCGNPKAGKSEIQKILQQEFNYQPVDDGAIIRRFGMSELGLTHDQVYTQAGKLETVEIMGRVWTVRELLGVYGNQLEAMFGKHVMPYFGTRNLDPNQFYSFASVRRDQGAFYKERGGVVIGVRNPTAGPSPYEFDRFDESLVDIWIDNDSQVTMKGFLPSEQLADLRRKVIYAISIINSGRSILNEIAA